MRINTFGADENMEYLTIKETAEKWGISSRAVTYHVVADRIPGAVKKGVMWLLPADTERPEDKRRKNLSVLPNKDAPK